MYRQRPLVLASHYRERLQDYAAPARFKNLEALLELRSQVVSKMVEHFKGMRAASAGIADWALFTFQAQGSPTWQHERPDPSPEYESRRRALLEEAKKLGAVDSELNKLVAEELAKGLKNAGDIAYLRDRLKEHEKALSDASDMAEFVALTNRYEQEEPFGNVERHPSIEEVEQSAEEWIQENLRGLDLEAPKGAKLDKYAITELRAEMVAIIQELNGLLAADDDIHQERIAILKAQLAALRQDLKYALGLKTTATKWVNDPQQPVVEGVTWDANTGVIKFSKPRGELAYLGVDALDQSLMVPANVSVIFYSEDKTDLNGPPEEPSEALSHRFSASFVSAGGQVQMVDRLEPSPEIMVIGEDKLVEHFDLSGASLNRSGLEAQALELAKAQLEEPGTIHGERPIVVGFVRSEVNGNVKSVTWNYNDSSAVTEINASTSKRGTRMDPARLQRLYRGRMRPTAWAAPGRIEKRMVEEQAKLKHPGLKPAEDKRLESR